MVRISGVFWPFVWPNVTDTLPQFRPAMSGLATWGGCESFRAVRADTLKGKTGKGQEAHTIVRALERCKPKNDGDRRFLESWRGYLNRTGDAAAIGKWRLQMLKRVAAAYGTGQADEPIAPQVVDILI